jgi:putative FmdB family regulatory protein
MAMCCSSSSTFDPRGIEFENDPAKVLIMPIYEFNCSKCGKDSEVLVRSVEWQGTPCPHCGSTRLSKKFSVFASSGSGDEGPACSGTPKSCGRCGTGTPHSH